MEMARTLALASERPKCVRPAYFMWSSLTLGFVLLDAYVVDNVQTVGK